MSTYWRASLVPAAAVIPAPRAYTNIAAVKTLVVCCRAQVCSVASVQLPMRLCQVGSEPVHWISTLGSMSCVQPMMCVNSSCKKSPSVEIQAVLHPMLVRASGSAAHVAQYSQAHHWSPPSLSLWKTQCAQSIQSLGRMSIHGTSQH